jgi:hypothetical protein
VLGRKIRGGRDLKFPKESIEFPSSSSEEELTRIEEAEQTLIKNHAEREEMIEKRGIIRELAGFL